MCQTVLVKQLEIENIAYLSWLIEVLSSIIVSRHAAVLERA
jgi:hypothetical protein